MLDFPFPVEPPRDPDDTQETAVAEMSESLFWESVERLGVLESELQAGGRDVALLEAILTHLVLMRVQIRAMSYLVSRMEDVDAGTLGMQITGLGDHRASVEEIARGLLKLWRSS